MANRATVTIEPDVDADALHRSLVLAYAESLEKTAEALRRSVAAPSEASDGPTYPPVGSRVEILPGATWHAWAKLGEALPVPDDHVGRVGRVEQAPDDDGDVEIYDGTRTYYADPGHVRVLES